METTEQQHDWLLAHPEEEAQYAGEFIAIADGQIVAHGKVCAEVLAKARQLGYEPTLARAHGEEAEVLSARRASGLMVACQTSECHGCGPSSPV
jgi:hypothetical protein